MKIWLCGQIASHGQEEHLNHIKRSISFFDGAVWVVNFKDSSSLFNYINSLTYYQLNKCLKENKKLGEIIPNRWVNRHDYAMTMFLQNGDIQNGDYVVTIDSQEELKPEFLNTLRQRIAQYSENNITAAYWGRPYIYKYSDMMYYVGNPHCWPNFILPGGKDDLRDESKVKYEADCVHFGDFLINRKKFENSYIMSAFKYIWCYPVSNEMQNQYGRFGDEIVSHHEYYRQNFREFWRTDIKLPTTIEAITKYFQENKGNYHPIVIEYVENEGVFKDFFRLKILNHSLDIILKNRNRWQFRRYLNSGDEIQKDSVYINARNEYNVKAGLPLED